MKIAVVGGGGFRTPVVWESIASVSERAGVGEVVLHDPSDGRLRRVSAVIEGLRRERGDPGPAVRTTTRLEDAIEGCGAVFCAIRVGGLEGRVVDETVPLELGVLGQETVGPGGIAFALRTVPVVTSIARAVVDRAPDAWFLNFTNPAGVVTESIRPVLGDRVVGVCDSPAALCARVAAALARPMDSLRFEYGGLNHLGWLTGVRENGQDLLPELLRDEGRLSRIEEAQLFGTSALRQLRMIPNEYLVYYQRPVEAAEAMRRAGATRAQLLLEQQSSFYETSPEASPEEALASWRRARDERHGTYMAEAWATAQTAPDSVPPSVPDEGPGEAGYAAIAASFLRAVRGGPDSTLILNTANRGRLPFLDSEAVVEAPCTVGSSGPAPLGSATLQSGQRELVERIKEVERLTIRAAFERSSALALAAIAAHPFVRSHQVAERILAGYLVGHPGLGDVLR